MPEVDPSGMPSFVRLQICLLASLAAACATVAPPPEVPAEPLPVVDTPKPPASWEKSNTGTGDLSEAFEIAPSVTEMPDDTTSAEPETSKEKVVPPSVDAQKADRSEAELALEEKRYPAALRAANAWLLDCGPDAVDECRSAAKRMFRTIAAKAKSPAITARLGRIETAERCLWDHEAAARKPQAAVAPCLAGAEATFRQERDHVMVARALLVKGIVASQDEKKREVALATFRRVVDLCKETRCVEVRRRALRRSALMHEEKAELDEAFHDALMEMNEAASRLTDEARLYARTDTVNRLCARIETERGAGACRKQEKAVNGRYTFFDYSKGKPQKALAASLVKEVGAHFAPLIDDCLRAEVVRVQQGESRNFATRWTIGYDGRVKKVKIGAAAASESPFGQCLEAQFAVWRYPRYQGEQQHVEQTFSVEHR